MWSGHAADKRPPPQFGPWLELDRVRSTLSFILLAGLLALIVIGSRRATGPVPHNLSPAKPSTLHDLLFVERSDGPP